MSFLLDTPSERRSKNVYLYDVTIEGVDFLEFGIPEAMWHVRVKDFSSIVTMDAHGNSLHAEVEKASAAELEKLKEAAMI